jgi:hypothetical protein
MMTDMTANADRSSERRSPLDLLNEKLRRLQATGTTAGSLALSEDRLSSMLEKLIDHADRSESRMNEITLSVARTESSADARLTEAMQAIAACIDAVEKAPKVTLNLIRTVSTRLDQIETRLPTLLEASTQPLYDAVSKLEGRLDTIATGGANDGLREDIAGLAARLERIAATIGGSDGADLATHSAIARVESRLATLSESAQSLSDTVTARLDRLHAEVSNGSVVDLSQAIGRLTDQIADWRMTMTQQIEGVAANLGEKIEGCAPGSAITELGVRVDSLGTKINAVAEGTDAETALLPLKKSLAELTRKVQAHKPVSLEGIETELKTILGRLDQDAAPTLDPATFDRISREIADVQALTQAQSRQIAEIRGLFETTGQHSLELGLVARGVSDLRDQVVELSQSLGQSDEAARNRTLAAIDQRLSSAIAEATASKADASFETLANAVSDARREMIDLRTDIQASEHRLNRALEAQGEMIARLSARLADVFSASVEIVDAPLGDDLHAEPASAPEDQDEPDDSEAEASAPEIIEPFAPPPPILNSPLRLKVSGSQH